jgi:UDP-N-acetylglucosamine 2-epimerase (non-hydrolysing)
MPASGSALRIVAVVGARPNFMKVAPILREIARRAQGGGAAPRAASPRIEALLVHTGQHYDERMSDAFFAELGLPRPDAFLEVGSGSHAEQTAEVMKRIGPVLASAAPRLALVVGDVNSTVASALTAVKMGIPVAHVEAGLRSFDRTMPEEINRIVTDAISGRLFTTEESARENLLREGIAEERISFVGNTMVDSLLHHLDAARSRGVRERLGLAGREYALLTLHRPSNVDGEARLGALLGALGEIARRQPILFPCHPRTRARLGTFGLANRLVDLGSGPVGAPALYACEPLGYLDFVALMAGARLVLTDSGGIQEETTCLGVPCLTLRDNTERPITVTLGTNRIVGSDPERVVRAADEALAAPPPATPRRPPLWDGRAAERIVEAIARDLA